MRASQEQIKAAILHPEEEVRVEAVDYWADIESPDPSIMPLVIQAVEAYGRQGGFGILRAADSLAQTPATLDWLMDELRRNYDPQDVEQDNYRFAVGLVLESACPDLLRPRYGDIKQLAAFPEQLRQPLNERLRMHLTDWPVLWQELERWAQQKMSADDDVSMADCRHVRRLIEALGRQPDQGERVIRALDGKVADTKRDLMEWLCPDLVELAGRMRLKQAVPRIMRRVIEGEEAVLDRASRALGLIGTDAVVEEIYGQWGLCDTDRRLTLVESLEMIQTDRCIDRCAELAEDEEDWDVAMFLANALLSQQCSEGVELAWALVLEGGEASTGDQCDLMFRAVAVATLTGTRFPEYERWHDEAVQTHYGCGDYRRDRISQHF